MVSVSDSSTSNVLYSERQWVPTWWWILAAAFAALLGAQMGNNRGVRWFVVTFVVVAALLGWFLMHLSSTVVRVEQDMHDGTRWLVIGDANLPQTVVSRSLAVPKTASQNALGRQLDPAAYLVHHAWVDELVLLVLDDPEDPTPYWLVSSKNPAGLLRAFVPDQADAALTPQT